MWKHLVRALKFLQRILIFDSLTLFFYRHCTLATKGNYFTISNPILIPLDGAFTPRKGHAVTLTVPHIALIDRGLTRGVAFLLPIHNIDKNHGQRSKESKIKILCIYFKPLLSAITYIMCTTSKLSWKWQRSNIL